MYEWVVRGGPSSAFQQELDVGLRKCEAWTAVSALKYQSYRSLRIDTIPFMYHELFRMNTFIVKG